MRFAIYIIKPYIFYLGIAAKNANKMYFLRSALMLIFGQCKGCGHQLYRQVAAAVLKFC